MTTYKGGKKRLTPSMEEKAASMRYNPLVASSSEYSLKSHYPDLYEIEAIRTFSNLDGSPDNQIWRNKAINYMIWLYSVDTMLNVKPVEPLKDRKLKAAHLAGFRIDDETNRFDDKVILDLMELADHEFQEAVVQYLIHQKDELFSENIVCEEQHHELMRLRLVPADSAAEADAKKKLRLESKELVHDIRQGWDEFWEDHDDLREEGQAMAYKSIDDRARINLGT